MLNNVVKWDIELPMYNVHGRELSCDIMNLSRYFIYLVMSRPFSGPLGPLGLDITW